MQPPILTPVKFKPEMWEEVKDFDCGSRPFEIEVSDWIKAKPGEGGAADSVIDRKRPSVVWLYKIDGKVAGFGAIAQNNWRWQSDNDPRIPTTEIIYFALQTPYKCQPESFDKSFRFSNQAMCHLISEAQKHKLSHPVLCLRVAANNHVAISFYDNYGFQSEGFSHTRNDTTGEIEYLQMAVVLDDDALRAAIQKAKEKAASKSHDKK